MRRWAVVVSALSLSLGTASFAAGSASAGNDNDPYTVSGGHAGPMAGVVPARAANAHAKPTKSPDLIYHGGVVRHSTHVQAIFWGTSWGNASFTDDKISGLETLYKGLTSSKYAGTNGEYTDSVLGAADPSVSYDGHILDTSKAVSRAPQTSDILNEVLRATNFSPVAGTYYPVYVDTPRGHAGYCAWHTSGSYGGVQFQFGFFFNLDGDPGCDPQAPSSLGHSQGLDALANVTGHEYSEMVTDPQLDAWYDSSGEENADKCAWTFGASPLPIGSGPDASWKIQGNWSNAAYDGNRGYVFGSSSVRGCIDGTNA